MAGFIKLHRGWHDNPLFKGEYSRAEAWLWLIENACWKPSKFDVKGKTIAIERGQLCTSRERLSSAWGWSPSAVERFLARLQTEQMIGRETGHGKTIITVCNYSKYQDAQDQTEQETGQETGQRSDRDRTAKEEGKEGKEEKNTGAYHFEGVVIKLNRKDFDQWEASFPAVDLRAALQSRDSWLAEQDARARKSWFRSTATWLANRQQAFKTEARDECEFTSPC